MDVKKNPITEGGGVARPGFLSMRCGACTGLPSYGSYVTIWALQKPSRG